VRYPFVEQQGAGCRLVSKKITDRDIVCRTIARGLNPLDLTVAMHEQTLRDSDA